MEEIKKSIDLQPLTDQEIKEKGFSLDDLWMIKDVQDKIYGPYDTNQLKVYIKDNEHLFVDSSIYNLEEEKWYKTFSLSHFQRRKPEVVLNEPDQEVTQFFLIFNGQKSGGYSEQEVKSFLKEGKITTTSELSIDGGKNWIKVYEYHAFDRRKNPAGGELPFQPSKDVLNKINKTKEEILNSQPEEEAIVQLALIGNKKSVEENQSQHIGPSEDELDQSIDKNSNQFIKILAVGAITLALIATGMIQIFNGFNSTNSVQKKTTEVKSINNSDRSVPKKIEKRTPARKVSKPKKISRTITRKKRVAPKRYRAQRPQRRVPSPKTETVRRQDIEEIDINNPEVQEQLTRELAGEGDLEELDEEELNLDNQEEDFPEDNEFGDEDLEIHNADDY